MADTTKQERFIKASQNKRLKAFSHQRGNYMGGNSFQKYELLKRADKLINRKIEKDLYIKREMGKNSHKELGKRTSMPRSKAQKGRTGSSTRRRPRRRLPSRRRRTPPGKSTRRPRPPMNSNLPPPEASRSNPTSTRTRSTIVLWLVKKSCQLSRRISKMRSTI